MIPNEFDTVGEVNKNCARDKAPLVTVVMPVFNAEAHSGAAVNSILKQSFTDFELLIIDRIDRRYRRTGEAVSSE